MQPRFLYGTFLRLTYRSDEILVRGEDGIRKARAIRRRSDNERWDSEAVLRIQGTHLQPNPRRDDCHITTRMEPGVVVATNLGEPLTKEDLSVAVDTL